MRAERGAFAINNWRKDDIGQYNKQIAETTARRGQEAQRVVRTTLLRRFLVGSHKR